MIIMHRNPIRILLFCFSLIFQPAKFSLSKTIKTLLTRYLRIIRNQHCKIFIRVSFKTVSARAI